MVSQYTDIQFNQCNFITRSMHVLIGCIFYENELLSTTCTILYAIKYNLTFIFQ